MDQTFNSHVRYEVFNVSIWEKTDLKLWTWDYTKHKYQSKITNRKSQDHVYWKKDTEVLGKNKTQFENMNEMN